MEYLNTPYVLSLFLIIPGIIKATVEVDNWVYASLLLIVLYLTLISNVLPLYVKIFIIVISILLYLVLRTPTEEIIPDNNFNCLEQSGCEEEIN